MSMNQAEYSQKISRILFHIRLIVNNVRLYSLNHSQVESQIGQVFKEFLTVFAVQPEITLMIIEGQLVINNRAIRGEEQKNYALFIKILREKEVGFVTFHSGMKKNELRLFLQYLAIPKEDIVPPFSSATIQVGQAGLKEQKKGRVWKGATEGKEDGHKELGLGGGQAGGGYRDEEIEQAVLTLNSMATDRLDIIKGYYHKMEHFGQCDTRNVEEIISVFIQCFSKNMNPLSMLASTKKADEYTFAHAVNVCILTIAQASALGFAGETLEQIAIAASLHDVGKIFLPEEVLNKPGKLSPTEREEIELHPVKGASYITNQKNISRLAILGALEHHIRYDGSGYPATGGKWKPHLVSQMIGISDTFDAMRSHRPYQESKPLKTVLAVLHEGKGTAYNPMLIDNFIRIVERQPRFK
ncbi:MAG: HD domain-containing phosphohydrolase [Thermodesulfobacteriota bacterium]